MKSPIAEKRIKRIWLLLLHVMDAKFTIALILILRTLKNRIYENKISWLNVFQYAIVIKNMFLSFLISFHFISFHYITFQRLIFIRRGATTKTTTTKKSRLHKTHTIQRLHETNETRIEVRE